MFGPTPLLSGCQADRLRKSMFESLEEISILEFERVIGETNDLKGFQI
jgi:hypothetical protein